MKNKKVIAYILVLVVITLVIFLVPVSNGEEYISGNEELYQEAISYIKEEEYQLVNEDHDKDSYHFFINYEGFGITKKGNKKFAYMWILGEGKYLENNEVKSSNGYSMFFKFTFYNDKVVGYENPEDGSYYIDSLKRMCIDKKMLNKITKYQSNLNNSEEINNYYSKIKDSKNLEKQDIIGQRGLLFSISYKSTNCIPILLSVYDNGKYELATHYKACPKNKVCTLEFQYTKYETGNYDYDVMNIIKNSINADNLSFTNEKMLGYELYTGKGDIVYSMITDSNNKYLTEFLKNINVNLHTCATPDYK